MSASTKNMQSSLGEMSTPKASFNTSSFQSYCKTELTTSSQESYCYLSPQDEYESSCKKGSAKSICSPPPTPRQYRSNILESEPSPESLQLQLGSGRSLLNSKSEAIRDANLRLSQRVMEMELNANARGSGRIPEMVLRAPTYPFLPTVPLNTSDDDNTEEDMPVIVTPIKLKMKPSKRYQPEGSDVVSAAARSSNSMDYCFFAPIRSGDEDDEFHADTKMED